jgi:hypothetical protein
LGMVETKNANLPGVAEEVPAILRCLDCIHKSARMVGAGVTRCAE